MRRLAAFLILLLGSTATRAEDTISFGLDWLAEAEYGGYYQALATGLYGQHGLKVTIRRQDSQKEDPGTVLNQDPAGGTKVDAGW